MTQPPGFARQSAPGPSVVAGVSLTAAALGRLDIDPKIKDQILKAFGDLLPGRPVKAGSAAEDRVLRPDTLAQLIPAAAVVASGFDPATVPTPVPDVLWSSRGQRILIGVAGVKASLGQGLIEIIVPVSCDQTGDVDVSISFVTGTPDNPAAGIMTTEDHPRGAGVIVENWAEPLIAYAWQILVTATSALSVASGTDTAGRSLITAAVSATPDGLTLTPMGRNTFVPDSAG